MAACLHEGRRGGDLGTAQSAGPRLAMALGRAGAENATQCDHLDLGGDRRLDPTRSSPAPAACRLPSEPAATPGASPSGRDAGRGAAE